VKKLVIVAVVALAAVSVAVTAALAKSSATADVCVLLPDTKSSVRWEQFDRPDIGKALKAAGVSFVINNAQGDAQKQRSQADQCLANGAKVLILTQLDAGSAISIQKAAAAKGAKSIDYDRQVIGGIGRIYISFDNPSVGVLQGKGVVAGLKANGMYSKKPVVAELNGGQEDGNSFAFKGGYDSILKPLYANGTFVKGPDQFTPAWNNDTARTIFEQMLVKTSNKIDAVAAANDGLANAVVTALKAHKLKPIPLSGQDATAAGVQNVISGWQSMTVYKAVPVEAAAAAKAAISLVKGTPLVTTGTVPNGKKKEPAFLIVPTSITKRNYTVLFKDKFLKRSEVCVGAYAKYCK
jgi:D-xylose transport system substrate-binding protein